MQQGVIDRIVGGERSKHYAIHRVESTYGQATAIRQRVSWFGVRTHPNCLTKKTRRLIPVLSAGGEMRFEDDSPGRQLGPIDGQDE
jgi:hypothetical protein